MLTRNPRELKVLYRKKSLLVHPDKCKHPRAQEAFAALSKANTELQDEARRAYLTSLADDARAAVMKERKLREGDEELTAPDFMPAVRKQVRRIIAENELRRREVLKRDLEEDARQKRTSDESVAELKKKQEDAKVWETGRDERVSDWRSFQAKKARTNGDFRPPKVTAEDPSKSFVRRVVPK